RREVEPCVGPNLRRRDGEVIIMRRGGFRLCARSKPLKDNVRNKIVHCGFHIMPREIIVLQSHLEVQQGLRNGWWAIRGGGCGGWGGKKGFYFLLCPSLGGWSFLPVFKKGTP